MSILRVSFTTSSRSTPTKFRRRQFFRTRFLRRVFLSVIPGVARNLTVGVSRSKQSKDVASVARDPSVRAGLALSARLGMTSLRVASSVTRSHSSLMVEVSIKYAGDLHCDATHGPSKSKIGTDAPTDNRGKGEAFSPTDLVATALGTCMSTIMGMKADELGLDLKGMVVDVKKEM